jgi:hypothetical protein
MVKITLRLSKPRVEWQNKFRRFPRKSWNGEIRRNYQERKDAFCANLRAIKKTSCQLFSLVFTKRPRRMWNFFLTELVDHLFELIKLDSHFWKYADCKTLGKGKNGLRKKHKTCPWSFARVCACVGVGPTPLFSGPWRANNTPHTVLSIGSRHPGESAHPSTGRCQPGVGGWQKVQKCFSLAALARRVNLSQKCKFCDPFEHLFRGSAENLCLFRQAKTCLKFSTGWSGCADGTGDGYITNNTSDLF